MKDIVIIGAGGFGREVAWLIEDINEKKPEWNLLGFVDDRLDLQQTILNGFPVLGTLDWLKSRQVSVVCAIGDPRTKKKVLSNFQASKLQFPVLIHPSTVISKFVHIGEGTIICAGNIITVNIEIGKHVIINIDCTIGHDVVIGDFSTVLPSVNVSGAVVTEECVSIGTGSQVIQGVRIGKNTIIGAGAVVTKDLPMNCVAVGIPAKPIKTFEE